MATPPLMVALPRRVWPQLLVVGALCGPSTALSQGLAGSAGAAAMQGNLNTVGVPGAQSTLRRARENSAALQALNGSASGDMAPPPAGAPPPPPPTSGATPERAAAPPELRGARINGRLVPYCSHGALCHGAMLRALGLR